MPITFALTPLQLTACIAVTFAAVALSYLLGIDEGRYRGMSIGRRIEREAAEKRREQLREEQWFPGGHRS
jgi:hypothetical protein